MHLIKNLKNLKNKYVLLHFIFNCFFRPRFQYKKYIVNGIQLITFSINSLNLIDIKNDLEKNKNKRENLFICAGENMESSWIQIWVTFSLLISDKIEKIYVLSSKKEIIKNLYFHIFKFKVLFLEDLPKEIKYKGIFLDPLNKLSSLSQITDFSFENVPFGRIALSTYFRSRKTGKIYTDQDKFLKEIINIIKYHYLVYEISKDLYSKYQIKHLFFTEVFMYEYGPFYYGALNTKLNILKFSGTVRDNAIVISRMNKESDRKHFSSFSNDSWEKILNINDIGKIKNNLEQNFIDRYSKKWFLSSRNHPNTKFLSSDQIKKKYNIQNDKKNAIIYSHILYDLLYFHGEDIFENYSDWFIETVKEIIKNKKINWFIKIHPSNVWRGETHKLFNIKTEEENLIKSVVGQLPQHIKIIYPTSEISPLSWMKFTDYGITVRGTSGIELAALGKQVITAGTGRYENIGFTINPLSKSMYLEILSKLHDIDSLGNDKHDLAIRFAYATFCLKPFKLDFMKVSKMFLISKVKSAEDLIYLPNKTLSKKNLPNSIINFKEWMFNSKSSDFLNPF